MLTTVFNHNLLSRHRWSILFLRVDVNKSVQRKRWWQIFLLSITEGQIDEKSSDQGPLHSGFLFHDWQISDRSVIDQSHFETWNLSRRHSDKFNNTKWCIVLSNFLIGLLYFFFLGFQFIVDLGLFQMVFWDVNFKNLPRIQHCGISEKRWKFIDLSDGKIWLTKASGSLPWKYTI